MIFIFINQLIFEFESYGKMQTTSSSVVAITCDLQDVTITIKFDDHEKIIDAHDFYNYEQVLVSNTSIKTFSLEFSCEWDSVMDCSEVEPIYKIVSKMFDNNNFESVSLAFMHIIFSKLQVECVDNICLKMTNMSKLHTFNIRSKICWLDPLTKIF